MSLWPTPTAGDGKVGQEWEAWSQARQRHAAKGMHKQYGLRDMALWPTPLARDHRSVRASPETHAANARPLSEVVGLALWSTPRASDAEKGSPNQSFSGGGQPLPTQAAQAHGTTPDGCAAPTARRGGLAPAFVCWLMGFPPAFLSCAPSATPSSRRSRPSS